MRPLTTIVMATYNGADYLPAQLDSILAQTDTGWRLLVSDDGSTDHTCAIVESYARSHGRIELIRGPGRGATQNFLHLLQRADRRHRIAFADQDDVWHADKLARASAWLAAQDGPAVYAARTTICDHAMRPLTAAPHFPGPFGFRNALIQSCLPGNTTVANAQALALMQDAAVAARSADVPAHDWWVYQVMAGSGAHIHRDAAQVLLYRQHATNVMGRNDTAKARAARFSMLFDGTFAGWLQRNQQALNGIADMLTPADRTVLARFGRLLDSGGAVALARMLDLRLRRQTTTGTLAVAGAALAGRLRYRKKVGSGA